MELEEWQEALLKGAAAMGLTLDAFQARQFFRHMCEMRHWNRSINLTAITEPEDIAIRHFLDAIVGADRIPDQSRLLDVGSGAGFPGLPLKVMRPRSHVTLIDSARKRVNFLRHTVRQLALDRVDVHHGRIEAFAAREGDVPHFNFIVSRALTGAAELTQMVMPLLRRGTTLLVWKGPDIQGELQDLRQVSDARGAVLSLDIFPYKLPRMDAGRHLIAINRE